MDGQLLYTFLSLATSRDTASGKKVPVEGMKLISALAHSHRIPVTWVVDSHSAQESKSVLLQGHQECGDDVILMIDIARVLRESGIASPTSKAEEIVVLRQNLPDFIASEREKVREVLPWSEVSVIAADMKTETLVQILEEAGCTGLYGYDWNPSISASPPDASPSRSGGCPWGFFYTSGEHHDAPSQSAGGLVAVESAALDLNAVFHTGNPRIFSAEPNSLRKSGLCSDEDVSYPAALMDEYLRNCSWNRFVTFIQRQPARDMEYASYDHYDKGTIAKIADIMSGFFREVESNPDIKALNLPQAINLYRREFEYTESCYMAFDSIVPPHIDVDFYVPPEPKGKPPYPFTFFYYDRECQLIFREGQMTPVEMRNYFRSPFDSRHHLEKEMPSISSFRPARDRDKLILEFEIESIKQMPFGLAIWDDHSMFSLVSTNARLVKWIGTHLLFIRLDLQEGLNRVEVSLTI